MNRALWKKAFADAWLHLLISCLLLAVFSLLFVWLMSQFRAGAFLKFLAWVPSIFRSLVQVPPELLALPVGRISVLYVHFITILVGLGWAVGRGSDPICGEIGRGTMDLLAALPVRRPAIMFPAVAVAWLGILLLVAAQLSGIWLGTRLCEFEEPVSIRRLLPGAANYCCLLLFVHALTLLVSAWNRDRWRAIAAASGLYVVAYIIEVVRRLWPHGGWLKWSTFLSLYRPQELILIHATRDALLWQLNGLLMLLALACYAAAAATFARRDIPASR